MPSSTPAYKKVVTSETPFGQSAEEDRLLQQLYHHHQGGGSSSSSISNTMMDAEVVPGRNIPSTHSSEELIAGAASSSDSEEGRKQSIVPEATIISRTNHRLEMFTVFVLCFVNLINYMDRFTIAGEFSGQEGSNYQNVLGRRWSPSIYFCDALALDRWRL